MTNKELNEVLENHRHFLKQDCDEWSTMCADLRYADLRGADLRYADLRGADLQYTILRYADLQYTNLQNAILQGADLQHAGLRGANLQYTILRYADLQGADLRGADLRHADLRDAMNVPPLPSACPCEGDFVAWKKCMDDKVVKLKVPSDARRSSATTSKCRCDKAEVLEIYNKDMTVAKERSAVSQYDANFVYTVGEIVSVDDFNENRWDECSNGIHFFIDRIDAMNY